MQNSRPTTTMAPKHLLALAISAAIVLGLALSVIPAFSQTHYPLAAFLRCTRDEGIMQAFSLMQDSQSETSLAKIIDRPVRVIFKDMKTLNKSVKKYDALGWISHSGERVIFINDKHRNAPPEALAAMIAHEAMHDDEFNSMAEEIAGWTFEAKTWIELKARNPELGKIPPKVFPLVDRENDIEAQYKKGTLSSFVRGNAGYAGLPEISPGFGDTEAGGHPNGDHS